MADKKLSKSGPRGAQKQQAQEAAETQKESVDPELRWGQDQQRRRVPGLNGYDPKLWPGTSW